MSLYFIGLLTAIGFLCALDDAEPKGFWQRSKYSLLFIFMAIAWPIFLGTILGAIFTKWFDENVEDSEKSSDGEGRES